MKFNLKRSFLYYKFIFILTIVLFFFGFIALVRTSSVLLLLFHLVFFLAVSYYYKSFVWDTFIHNYVYMDCDLEELEKLFVSTNNARDRVTLNRVAFLTGNTNKINNNAVKVLMNIEEDVWQNENIDIEKQLQNSEDVLLGDKFSLQYTNVLNNYVNGNYDDALEIIDSLSTGNPLDEIPRYFYLAMILSKKYSKDYWEVKTCINYILNRGEKTRYKQYIYKYFDGNEYSVEESTECIRPNYWIVSLLYLLWIILIFMI